MKGVQKFCPIYTLCVGNAFGEAALLLSAGSPVRHLAQASEAAVDGSPLSGYVPAVWLPWGRGEVGAAARPPSGALQTSHNEGTQGCGSA